jgi:hypothetical protein
VSSQSFEVVQPAPRKIDVSACEPLSLLDDGVYESQKLIITGQCYHGGLDPK